MRAFFGVDLFAFAAVADGMKDFVLKLKDHVGLMSCNHRKVNEMCGNEGNLLA